MQEKFSMHIFISFDYPTNQTLNSTVLKKEKNRRMMLMLSNAPLIDIINFHFQVSQSCKREERISSA